MLSWKILLYVLRINSAVSLLWLQITFYGFRIEHLHAQAFLHYEVIGFSIINVVGEAMVIDLERHRSDVFAWWLGFIQSRQLFALGLSLDVFKKLLLHVRGLLCTSATSRVVLSLNLKPLLIILCFCLSFSIELLLNKLGLFLSKGCLLL